jgi:predicted membrane channel-forming protein YqfA (hemolysin III family)
MLIVNKVNAYIGLLLALIAASIAPILKVPIKGNWNLYQTDIRLFFITISIIALVALTLFVRQLKAFRIMSFVLFFWTLLMAAAVYFKSNNYFNSKFFDKVLAKTIHYQWGWIVMLVAVLLLVTSVRKMRLEEGKI